MIIGKPIRNGTPEWVRETVEIVDEIVRERDAKEHEEALREECESLNSQVPAAIAKRDPLHELEKLQAASLVMMARDIDSQLPRMGNIERGAFGRAARQLAAQLLDAARKSDRYVPEEVPEFLMKAGAL